MALPITKSLLPSRYYLCKALHHHPVTLSTKKRIQFVAAFLLTKKDATFCLGTERRQNCCALYCTESKQREKMQLRKEDVMTIPNLLSAARILSTPFLGYLIVTSQYEYAIGLLIVSGITDALDGWIARAYPSQASVLGSALDPFADKLLIGTLVISMFLNGDLPGFLTYLIVGRDVLLMAAGFVLRYRSLDPPITLRRFFDISKPTVQLTPTLISKVNTALQLGTLALTLCGGVWIPVRDYLPFMWYTTAGTTIASAFSYIFQKDTYKYMSKR